MITYAKLNQPRNEDKMEMFLSLSPHIQTFICCGRTDLRKQIDGLCAIVENEYGLNPFSKSMYLFCGNSCDRLSILYFDGFAFIVMKVRTEEKHFKWPRNEGELWKISRSTLIELLSGNPIPEKRILRVFKRLS